ncbi:MAG TPA: quinone-dependent dihydroorotate dehydrogenase, partial [Afifellaceae bacterium]|nr:quinone-dependent dihydroorotate dehydrogenase [Afifellaceae bacterium]
MSAEGLALRLMRLLPPETAHRLTIAALARRGERAAPRSDDPRLRIELLGLTFPSPIGLAAGFDKNAEVAGAMLGMGFGFVEVGTVTPKPQEGNPPPRLFRLPADRAVINRLGFNNQGHDAAASRLERQRGLGGIVGVNVGANRDSTDRIGDYVAGLRRFAGLASYLTINVSSPNTPGLRELQKGSELEELLTRIVEARATLAEETGRGVPLLLKIAPDMDDAELQAVVEAAERHRLDGLIVSNTTLSREKLKSRRHAGEAGGLSGPPLFERSTAMLARARQLAAPKLALIGVGGVDSAAAAWAKIVAGADLVQLYTGLIYAGPALVGDINAGLLQRLEARNFGSIAEARGIETARWAAAWPQTPARAEAEE